MPDMTPQLVIARAKEAAHILENEAFNIALTQLKDDVVQQWKDCPIRDKEGQLLLLQLAKLTDKFEHILRGMVEGGKLANYQLDIDSVRDENITRRFFRKVSG